MHVCFIAFALLGVTLFYIERGVWPVLFETLALAYLIVYFNRYSREEDEIGFGMGALFVMAVAFYLQAMILRVFGPDIPVMDASDIYRMQLPAVASLMWVIFGAGLAWWGTRRASRSLWSIGSVLLLAAALKLVLFDFGALGQLGNIFAFIAAGLVFMAVAWFAPMPPKAERGPAERSGERGVRPAGDSESQETGQLAEVAGKEKSPEAASAAAAAPDAGAASERQDAAASEPVRPAAPRRRAAPDGINGLWLVLLGGAIIIALSAAIWHKQLRLRQVRLERHVAEDVRRAAWQRELEDVARPLQMVPQPRKREPGRW